MRPGRIWYAAAAAAAAAAACTNAYLYDERRDLEVPRDRTVVMQGEFCTPSANQVVRPIKVLMAMDASQSMRVTDPNGTRAMAVVELMDNLPQEPEIEFVVMLFAGSTTAWLTKSGLTEFERVIDFTDADKTALRQRILNFSVPGNEADRDSTDFVKPLSDIYALISRDIGETRLTSADAGLNADDTRPRYSVIFLSDGQPTVNQDLELLCGDAVKRIRQLKDLADDVTVNTVHVFVPTQPIASTTCEFDGGLVIPAKGPDDCGIIPNLPLGACPLLVVNQNAQRLETMAELGGGSFRDFRNNEAINFLNFRFGQVRRAFIFDKLIASNFSAPADSPIDQPVEVDARVTVKDDPNNPPAQLLVTSVGAHLYQDPLAVGAASDPVSVTLSAEALRATGPARLGHWGARDVGSAQISTEVPLVADTTRFRVTADSTSFFRAVTYTVTRTDGGGGVVLELVDDLWGGEADTDSDGLTDARELRPDAGLNPWVADSDGDGFSDGVEVYFRARGAIFTPNQVAQPDGGGLDLGCPPELRGRDSDCDGLTDCDEQIIGTNATRLDSDDDGVPDSVEFKLGTQPSSKDLDQDPDNDRLFNRDELAMHTDPLAVDSQRLSEVSYRVTVDKDGGFDADGRQCFSFKVANISLANTIPDSRDAGNPDGGAPLYRRGAGYNDLFLSVSMRPGDDPAGHTSLRVFRHTTSRFPVGGIRSSPDGRIVVRPDDFVAGCKAP